jgi:hypothetical protein
MNFFYIEPEVAGGLGDKTVMDRRTHPPIVSKLHYHFDGWLGDALLESFPCFIVTEEARRSIEETRLTGARFDQVEVTTSEQFEELYPTLRLPKFQWLRVEGKVGEDDFGLAPDARLVVSERALDVLREVGLSHAEVSDFEA